MRELLTVQRLSAHALNIVVGHETYLNEAQNLFQPVRYSCATVMMPKITRGGGGGGSSSISSAAGGGTSASTGRSSGGVKTAAAAGGEGAGAQSLTAANLEQHDMLSGPQQLNFTLGACQPRIQATPLFPSSLLRCLDLSIMCVLVVSRISDGSSLIARLLGCGPGGTCGDCRRHHLCLRAACLCSPFRACTFGHTTLTHPTIATSRDTRRGRRRLGWQ